jgi:hypothetical protein
MNFIQEVLNLLDRKQDKKKLDLRRDWFEFGRTRPSSVGNPLYTPKMNPHAIRYDDLKCNIISGLVSGTGTEYTLPMWSTIDTDNCNVQTIIDSVYSQDAGASEGLVSANFRVTGNTVLEGDLLVLGTQTIVESTIVQVADNIMQINSGGAGVDAGIEVIQPSGTKTWAWDNAQGMWSTFGDSILTTDITIQGAIKQDGEILVNVVNEAEGLASQDNDESLATVAAIIDWSDQMDLDVSADTGIPLDILLNSETLQIRGDNNITTYADGGEKIAIQLNDDIEVNSVTTEFLILNGAPGPYQVASIVNDINDTVDPVATLLTVEGIKNYIDSERDYLSNVALTGTNLNFTGVNNAFTGSIDLSSLLDDTNLSRLVSGVLSGTDLVLTRDDATDFIVDLSALSGNSVPVMSATVTGTGKLKFDDVQPEPAVAVSSIADRTYGVQFNDAEQLVVNVPWETGSIVIGNPGSPTLDLTSISIDGTVYGIASGGGGSVTSVGLSTDIAAFQVGSSPITSNGIIELNLLGGTAGQFLRQDGNWADIPNNFVTDVQLIGQELIFTGTGDAFSGSIDLASLLDNTDAQTLSLSGTDLTISNGNTVDLSSLSGSSYTASNGIELVTATEFGLIDVVKTDTSSSESPNHTDTFTVIDSVTTNSKGQVTEVNTKEVTLPASGTGADGVITNVSLAGTDLEFTGANGGFSGSIDLSTLQDGNDNDIDYVSGVALNGSNLDFTGVGNSFAGSIDLSSLSTTETLTNLSINANILTYRDELGNDTDIDLNLYLDDSNLARLTSGTLDAATGIATFTRDDLTTFDLNLSSLLDTDTNYDLGAVGVAGNVNIALSGSDGSNDVVEIQAGTNITLTDNGSNSFTIDAAGGGTDTTYDLASRAIGSDVALSLDGSDLTSDIVTLVAGSNITLTDNGSNEITIDADAASTCVTAIGYKYDQTGNQFLSSSFSKIVNPANNISLGFGNSDTIQKFYAITWTIEYGMSGDGGVKSFETQMSADVGGTVIVPVESKWADSGYMVSEYSTTRTYTLNVNLNPGDSIYPEVKGSIDVFIKKANMLIVESTCDSIREGTIQPVLLGENPRL